MRAVVITRNGGPEVLELQEVPVPVPGPNELLVKVEAVGVNYRDVYERVGGGAYDAAPGTIAGVEGAGTIVSVGDGDGIGGVVGSRPATGWRGRPPRAATPSSWSSPRTRPCRCRRASRQRSPRPSCCRGSPRTTLRSTRIRSSRATAVLVHAAAGGVGLLLTQIAKLKGARVIATTSGGEKADLARGAGADEVIGYEGFHERVRELTNGEGVAAVYDGIGRTTFDDGLKALRPTGSMILYGSSSGRPDPLDTRVLAARGSLYVQRPVLGVYIRTSRAAARPRRAGLRLGARGQARRPHRRPLPARSSGEIARGSRSPPHDGQAAPHPLSPRGQARTAVPGTSCSPSAQTFTAVPGTGGSPARTGLELRCLAPEVALRGHVAS